MEVKLKKKGTRVTWKNQPDCVQETTLRESIWFREMIEIKWRYSSTEIRNVDMGQS